MPGRQPKAPVHTDHCRRRVRVPRAPPEARICNVLFALVTQRPHIAALLIDYGRDRTSQIVVIGVADGRVTQLKSLGWDGAELGGFSPDGRLIVYTTGFQPLVHRSRHLRACRGRQS